LDTVLAGGREFGIPVALNMPEDVPKRVQQGASWRKTVRDRLFH
jgi:hypothetical protein